MQAYRGKQIAILGVSTEGKDSALYFLAHGAQVTCCDRRTKTELADIYQTLVQAGADFQLGANYLENLSNFDLLIRTPGMSPRLPELVKARTAGVCMTTQTQLFFENCKAPIIGVTGTKGKGTTTTLIAELLKQSGFTTWVGGNVGIPLLTQVEKIKPNDWVVLELSSFQLENVTISPHIAVVLSITSDHLVNSDPLATNFHPNRADYISAKSHLVSNQHKTDYAVINANDATAKTFISHTVGHTYYFSQSKQIEGAYVLNEKLYVSIGGKTDWIADTTTFHLRGRHNWDNIAAAVTAAFLAGAQLSVLRQVVPAFKGLEHRLELVDTIGGVSYYNDSFATTPETTIAAINAFTEPITLIVGGADKGSDYTQLGQTIVTSNVTDVILIGKMAVKIRQSILAAHKSLPKSTVPNLHIESQNMAEIVALASRITTTGGVVVLSPACASFGMFKNYKERGMLFKQYVKNLSQKSLHQ
jgi:UDP-N-acetylmuramoylalanine--D-glutamate ligase